jgi:hypothetical protein
MEPRTAYCTACQAEVHLTLTPAPVHGGTSSLPDGNQLVCLTFGSRCAGGACPIGGVPSVVMGVRLARSGFDPDESWKLIHMHCASCGRVTEMEVLDNVHAFCPICETTSRWMTLDMGEEALVVPLA